MADDSDPIRALIRRRLEELGLDMASVSRDGLKRNHAYLEQYLSRGVPRRLAEDDRATLATILKIPEDRLKPQPSSVRPAASAPQIPAKNLDNKDVPVWGTVEGGPNGSFEVYYGSDPVDYVRRFPGIEKAREVYALYVVGDSMYPAHKAGDLIYVNPSKAPVPGCDVVVQIKPDREGDAPRCYLKRLVRRSPDKVVCEQFCPPQPVTYAQGDIQAVHRVLTLVELAGA